MSYNSVCNPCLKTFKILYFLGKTHLKNPIKIPIIINFCISRLILVSIFLIHLFVIYIKRLLNINWTPNNTIVNQIFKKKVAKKFQNVLCTASFKLLFFFLKYPLNCIQVKVKLWTIFLTLLRTKIQYDIVIGVI